MHRPQPAQAVQIGGPWVAVTCHPVHTPWQLNTSWLITGQFKALIAERHEFRFKPAVSLGLQRQLMTVEGEAIHFVAAQTMPPGQVVGGGDHVYARGRVVEGFPEKVLERYLRTEPEAAAVGVGGNRISRHGLGRHA
ncbi:hypothetical protein D3C85_1555220 [compost metagenome]